MTLSYPHIRSILLRHCLVAALTAILWGALPAMAQADMQFTQFWALPTLYNPARTGDTDFIRIRGGARLQWLGITNAPKSFVATGDMPWKIMEKRIGMGVTLSQESIGLFSNLLINAQGSYKLKFLKGNLSLGFGIGYYNSRFKGSEVYIPGEDDYHESTDPSIPTQDLSGNSVDISLGINYSHKLFYVGISALHLLSPKVNLTLEGNESADAQQYQTELPRTVYFEGGSNIAIRNTLFEVQPSLLVATDFNTFSADISLRATYNKFIIAGIGYRWNDAVSVMIGANYRNFFLGYAFDYSTSALARASSGSHEIVAGYQLKLDLSGKNKNKHRSIRIM